MITNFGLMTLYQTISNENNENVDCFQPTSSHLLWSSPEVKLNPCRWGSKESDVFSLSIIMSEVINQSSPYNSQDSKTTDSIIRSIGSGIYVRPTVDSTDVPDDIIDLMEQCWSDNPDRRPSIDDIHEKFSAHSEGKNIHNNDSLLDFQFFSAFLNYNRPVADALKLGQTIEPDKFEEVTVYFSDIVGFTTISAYSRPIEIISLLNDLYTSFDRIIDSYQVYKVETIGDAYMVVSGVPERRSDHAEQIADMALDILHSCTQIKIAHLPGVPLKIRIGINTGKRRKNRT
uniref:guanylate cyclase n=1 Tax=Tetranychus urticae TaxID=32264 RepID=T1JRQ2_TETUR